MAAANDKLEFRRAIRDALPHLEKGRDPAIINIASGSGINPSVRTPAYGATKAAVIHYTVTQAAMYAKDRIRVNCIAPALVDTALAARLLSSPEKREALAARSPMRRFNSLMPWRYTRKSGEPSNCAPRWARPCPERESPRHRDHARRPPAPRTDRGRDSGLSRQAQARPVALHDATARSG